MKLKILSVAVYCCVIASTQKFKGNTQCQDPPVFNCNCGSPTKDKGISNNVGDFRIHKRRPSHFRRVGQNVQKVCVFNFKSYSQIKS